MLLLKMETYGVLSSGTLKVLTNRTRDLGSCSGAEPLLLVVIVHPVIHWLHSLINSYLTR